MKYDIYSFAALNRADKLLFLYLNEFFWPNILYKTFTRIYILLI